MSQAGRFTDLERYREDPVGFAEQVLGLTLWSRQREMLEAIRDHSRVVVRSGHKTGKSLAAIAASLWWVCTRPMSRVILTAPTFAQTKAILWLELRRRIPAAGLGGDVPRDPAAGIEFDNGSRIEGISAAKTENLAGLSAPGGILFVVDEATGYPDELYEAVRGNMGGGGKLVGLSNATPQANWFVRAFQGDGNWFRMRISSEESPNVLEGREVIAGLATLEWLQEMREDCGPDYENDPVYQTRVLGIFPKASDDLIIGMDVIENAMNRWTPSDAGMFGPLVVGVDPARWGSDPSAIALVRGAHCYGIEELGGKQSGFDIAEAVFRLALPLRRGVDVTIPVVVDHKGPGAATVDALRHLVRERSLPFVVIEHEGDARARDPDRYANRRAEVWYELGKWLAQGGRIPRDEQLSRELTAARREYKGNLLAVERKDKTKRRGAGSPNRADALTLAASSGAAVVEPSYNAGGEGYQSRGRAQWM